MLEEEQPRWLLGYEGYDSRQTSKMAHLEAMEDGSFLLFDYKNRDPLDKNAAAMRFSYTENKNSGASGFGAWNQLPLFSEL